MDRYFDIQVNSKRGRRMFVRLEHNEHGMSMLGRVVDDRGVDLPNENGKLELCMFLPSCIHAQCVLTPRGLEPLPADGVKRPENLAGYPTPMRGDPRLHHEIACSPPAICRLRCAAPVSKSRRLVFTVTRILS